MPIRPAQALRAEQPTRGLGEKVPLPCRPFIPIFDLLPPFRARIQRCEDHGRRAEKLPGQPVHHTHQSDFILRSSRRDGFLQLRIGGMVGNGRLIFPPRLHNFEDLGLGDVRPCRVWPLKGEDGGHLLADIDQLPSWGGLRPDIRRAGILFRRHPLCR
jgi:hypothetical protein